MWQSSEPEKRFSIPLYYHNQCLPELGQKVHLIIDLNNSSTCDPKKCSLCLHCVRNRANLLQCQKCVSVPNWSDIVHRKNTNDVYQRSCPNQLVNLSSNRVPQTCSISHITTENAPGYGQQEVTLFCGVRSSPRFAGLHLCDDDFIFVYEVLNCVKIIA